MKAIKIFGVVLSFAAIVFVVQYLFIAYIPDLIFAIAKRRSEKPLNSVIHAPRTDAKLRRVVLPNPDFIYSACFYDASENDLMITGEFPDSTQYGSLAFYGSNIQPYLVMNNQNGRKTKFKLRLTSVSRVHSDIISPNKQGAILLRMLAVDSAQIQKALSLQKTFKVVPINQNE